MKLTSREKKLLKIAVYFGVKALYDEGEAPDPLIVAEQKRFVRKLILSKLDKGEPGK